MSKKPKVLEINDWSENVDLSPVSEPEPIADDDETETAAAEPISDDNENDYDEEIEDEEDDAETVVAQPSSGSRSSMEAIHALKQLAIELNALYVRYANLHTLAKTFNGVSESSPFPENVTIKKISIEYQINDERAVVAEIGSPRRIGELSNLLRAEVERLVDGITNKLTKIREISTASEQACTQAKFYSRMAQSKNVPS